MTCPSYLFATVGQDKTLLLLVNVTAGNALHMQAYDYHSKALSLLAGDARDTITSGDIVTAVAGLFRAAMI